MQAAIGVAQLDKLSGFIEKRKHNFARLKKGLMHLEKEIILPAPTENSEPCWFGFPICYKEKDKLILYLEKNKIMTRHLFAGNITKQPYFENIKYRAGILKNTDMIVTDCFWIGVYPGIDDVMIDYMVEKISAFFRQDS